MGSLLLTLIFHPPCVPLPTDSHSTITEKCFCHHHLFFCRFLLLQEPARLHTCKLACRHVHSTQSRGWDPSCSSRQTMEGGKECSLCRAAADMHPLFGFGAGPCIMQRTAIKTARAVLSWTVNYWLITQPAWMSITVWSAVAAPQHSCQSPRAGSLQG